MAVMPDVLVSRARLMLPRIQRDWIPRPDLLHALKQADHVPVTLIVAPSGTGKSGLLAQWAASRREPVAWLALDARDNSLVALATMLAHAINEVEPETIAAPLRYLEFVPGAPDPDVVATYFLNDLADLTADLSLVLDDVHVITDPGAAALLQALAEATMPGLRLLISSRTEPPWPLSSLRASGRLLELRAGHLRLTPAETKEYAERVWGGPVPMELAAAICTHAVGWLTGIRFLCAGTRPLRISGEDEHTIDPTLSGEAMGWLLNEALSAYHDPARGLLLRLAIPERVNRHLAEELARGLCSAAEARETYDALVEDGLFLVDTGEAAWSKIPNHVRQILITRLAESEGHATVRRWRGIVRDWLLDQGLYEDSIAQARAMGDPAAAVAVIQAAIEPTLAAGEWRRLEAWLSALPTRVVDQDAELLLGAAWTVLLREDRPRARALAQDAERLIVNDPGLAERRRVALTARVRVVEAAASYMLGDGARARLLVADAIPRLAPEQGHSLAEAHFIAALSDFLVDPAGATERLASRLAGAAVLPPRVYLKLLAALGIITYQTGDMRRTGKVAAQMRELGVAQGFVWVASWGDALAAIAAYERNELDAAVAHATALLERPQGMHRIAVRECLYILALSYEARQQWDDADLTLDRLEEFLLTENSPHAFVDTDALRGRFAVRRGAVDRARAWLERATIPDTTHPSHSMGDARIAHLAVAVSLGLDLTTVVARIDQILAAGTMYDSVIRRVELMLLLAIGHYRLGHQAPARATLAEALTLTQPAGMTRVFLDLGPALLPLLDDAITAGIPGALEAQRLRDLVATEATVARHKAQPARTDQKPRSTAGKMLTEREQEILELVAEGLSNKEIGARLGISPLTVKRHTINIYAKLGVTTRRQAVHDAIDQGLVSGLAPSW